MALFFGHTKASIKLIVNELKSFSLIANFIAQLATIGYLSYNLITQSGLWYINLALLVLALSYFIFTLVCYVKEVKKEVQNEVKLFLKWSKRVIKLFPIGVAIYSLFLAASNLTPIALISPIVITVTWLLDVLINILCLIVEARFSLILESLAEDVGHWPIVGNWANQLAFKPGTTTQNEKMDTVKEMAAAEAAE